MLSHLPEVTEQVDGKAQERTLHTQAEALSICVDLQHPFLENYCFWKILDLNEAIHMGNRNPSGLGPKPRPECCFVAFW